jgi:hypothetical protein
MIRFNMADLLAGWRSLGCPEDFHCTAHDPKRKVAAYQAATETQVELNQTP